MIWLTPEQWEWLDELLRNSPPAERLRIAQAYYREESVRRLAEAPLDDEPITEEDEQAVREGREAAKRGDVLTTAELRMALGIDGDEDE